MGRPAGTGSTVPPGPPSAAGVGPAVQPSALRGDAGGDPSAGHPRGAAAPAGAGGENPAMTLISAHLQLRQDMENNLRKLRQVISESQAIAQQMEQLLATTAQWTGADRGRDQGDQGAGSGRAAAQGGHRGGSGGPGDAEADGRQQGQGQGATPRVVGRLRAAMSRRAGGTVPEGHTEHPPSARGGGG